MKIADPPKELLEQRPALAFEEVVFHPETSPTITTKPPAKYTKALHERICEELKKGQSRQGAAARAGITAATLSEWIRRGQAGDPWLYRFAQDVDIAENSFEADAVAVVVDSFSSTDPNERDVEKAQWMLERTRPSRYSKQVRTAVENQIQQFLQRLEHHLDPETFERVLAIYLGQSAAPLKANPELVVASDDATGTIADAEIE